MHNELHDLYFFGSSYSRNTYITNLIHASVDPKTVQYLAGHENSKITMDIYAKVKYNKPEQLSAAINKAFCHVEDNDAKDLKPSAKPGA